MKLELPTFWTMLYGLFQGAPSIDDLQAKSKNVAPPYSSDYSSCKKWSKKQVWGLTSFRFYDFNSNLVNFRQFHSNSLALMCGAEKTWATNSYSHPTLIYRSAKKMLLHSLKKLSQKTPFTFSHASPSHFSAAPLSLERSLFYPTLF